MQDCVLYMLLMHYCKVRMKYWRSYVGAYFTEIELAEIAKEFDEEERRVMMEMGTETKEFLQFLAVLYVHFLVFIIYQEDSGNLADDGNYSIQVRIWALNYIYAWNVM